MILLEPTYVKVIDYTSQLPLQLEVANEMSAEVMGLPLEPLVHVGGVSFVSVPFLSYCLEIDEIFRAIAAILQPQSDLESRSYKLRMWSWK